MKKLILYILLLCSVNILFQCTENTSVQPNWQEIKNTTFPSVSITSEYGTPYRQNLSVGGWEDGVFITRDGLNLYCFYTPIDLLSWQFTGSGDPSNFSQYLRTPTFGIDLISNTIGATEWLQSDILISQRTNTTHPFSTWQLSNLTNPIWSEGAPQINTNISADLFVYTSNNVPPSYKTDIMLLQNVGLNPTDQGTALPLNVNGINSREDNPHIERIDAQNLVLFFDSDDKPNGIGFLDIWYTTSPDNGTTWTHPNQVSSLNTLNDEQQPHLYNNGTDWYIYYTGTNTTTGKTEIYRAKQNIAGDWDSWTNKESVIGVGNAFAVGEPTLTQYGDISFVVIYEDSINGTSTNKYDADPWFLSKI